MPLPFWLCSWGYVLICFQYRERKRNSKHSLETSKATFLPRSWGQGLKDVETELIRDPSLQFWWLARVGGTDLGFKFKTTGDAFMKDLGALFAAASCFRVPCEYIEPSPVSSKWQRKCFSSRLLGSFNWGWIRVLTIAKYYLYGILDWYYGISGLELLRCAPSLPFQEQNSEPFTPKTRIVLRSAEN